MDMNCFLAVLRYSAPPGVACQMSQLFTGLLKIRQNVSKRGLWVRKDGENGDRWRVKSVKAQWNSGKDEG